jgi:DNA-binding transcriptional ArsR family regulator
MLAFVPVVFDAYRTVRPALRWTLQNLVGFADRTGRCFPSVRKLAAVAGLSKSTASRHLADLARDGILTRQRRPGGCYSYTIAARFLPAARVSHKRDQAVPPARTEENPIKKNPDGLPDDSAKWKARLRSWRKSRFWLPFWGPKPTEAGCFVPPELLGGAVR